MIIDEYHEKCRIPSGTNEHLPTLKRYTEECKHVTEFGVDHVVSTWALLAGNPDKVVSYDQRRLSEVEHLLDVTSKEKCNFTFVEQSTLECVIEETDLLFIDTLHSYKQLSQELERHHSKVKKYIIMHDTVTFGEMSDEAEGRRSAPGLNQAIRDFQAAHPEWKTYEVYYNNNGLTILKRQTSD
jgi:hypothetical protein